MSKYSGKCFKCGRVLTRCECNKQQPKAYATELQSEQEKRKEAEDMMEKMATDLELIVKWCNSADIKAVAIDNPIHMAVYRSLNQSMQALTEFLKFKAKKDGTVNR